MNLNTEQTLASTAPLGHNLIIASAGTGKTATIVARIAFLLEQGIPPTEILLLTFTNKAAQEMLIRLNRLFQEDIGIEAGTFHSLSYRYLKTHKKITLKQPRELKKLFEGIYEKYTFTHSGIKPYGHSYLYELHSYYQNIFQDLDFGEWLAQTKEEQNIHTKTYMQILTEFQALKQTYGYADFNDLLILYRQEILHKRQTQNIYQEVLVDEYQDTNPLQDSILKALNPPSLFCVGDYDQSIYAFNGADISIIASFKDRFAYAKVFNLSKNYRSNAPILELANRVIEHNERIYPKKLEVVKHSKNASEVKLLEYSELFEQYKGIAEKISQSHTPHSEIAVIFRNNVTADGIEACLREIGIPSRRKGGVGFFESKEITLMLDLLSLFHNPRDMIAFIHILSYAKGVGSSIAQDIYTQLIAFGHGDLYQGLFKPDHSHKITQEQISLFSELDRNDKISTFQAEGIHQHFLHHPILTHPKLHSHARLFLNELFCLLRERDLSTIQLIQKCENSKLFQDIISIFARERSTKNGHFDENRYIESLDKIATKIKILKDLSRNYNHLGSFLNAMILGGNEMSEGSGVNLLSVHSSKGLEYEEVFVIDLMEGRFPNRKLMAKSNTNIEEERRLFYVAVTRAKEILYLSYAKSDRVKNLQYQASIFLKEAGFAVEVEE
ncbi:ATP-dependent helicase [Helicobacter monodelphidis]|uniref:ATP-dependent helicase n=1 Tax=Helicobacter sp. 15-1451 TaxID=2004995 RepID=UPI00215C6B8C|nr:ATP-dependent helicase [Helicobacter sp. 15-1451]